MLGTLHSTCTILYEGANFQHPLSKEASSVTPSPFLIGVTLGVTLDVITILIGAIVNTAFTGTTCINSL